MDAESLAQIEHIVTSTISGTEERLRHEFGEKTETLGSSLRQEFRQQTEMTAASVREEFGEKTDALAITLRQELAEKFDEAERHSGLLFEEMGRRLDLVIEGFEGLREQLKNLDEKIEHESLETRALIQLSYRQLQARVETLEQKVQIIEKRLGLSA